MTKAIRIEQNGGPEVMKYVDVEVGDPGPGEARVRHNAVGLNYIDVYFRTGLYPQPLPAGLGMEAAGVVEAVGEGVTLVKAGDRVAYASRPCGAYSQARVMPVASLVRLPDSISDDQAAAMMLQGMTAQYLLRRTYPVKAGDTILIHAAAGGVGLIVCQWAKALGATVIGTVGSDEKAALARWLMRDSRVLILDEPTRGVDIGAKREIYELIDALARAGKAVLVISSDLPEAIGISDRLLVMREGRIVHELSSDRAAEEEVMAYATGTAGRAAGASHGAEA